MKTTINFTRWLERLGVKDGRQPEVLRAVQPVQVVSDASLLVSPLLPPSGLAGTEIPAELAERACIEVYGGYRGGALVEFSVTPHSQSMTFLYRVSAAAFTVNNLIPLEDVFFQPDTTVRVRIGTVLGLVAAGWPRFRAGTAVESLKSVFVPPGVYGLLMSASVNQVVQSWVTYQEFAAAPGPA